MNISGLETLIRNILSEQLAPAKAEVQGNGIFSSVSETIDAIHQAFLRYQQCLLKTRNAIINALHEELTPHLASLAARGTAETGTGNKEDKFLKNKATLDNTPGIEDLTITALISDGGMVLFKYLPFGVIDSVAPGTNPTETIINNSINTLAAGNSVYSSPRPGVKKVSLKLITTIEDIAFHCREIHNLVVTATEPTFGTTQQMMAHSRIAVLAITGDPGIIAMNMKNGKKVISAGTGNPPCIVDETANLIKAAEGIINGTPFDYSLLCIAEKSLIVVDVAAERPVQQMQSLGAMFLNSEGVDKLRVVCLPEDIASEKLMGKSPATSLEAAGIPIPAKAPRLPTDIVKADDP